MDVTFNKFKGFLLKIACLDEKPIVFYSVIFHTDY